MMTQTLSPVIPLTIEPITPAVGAYVRLDARDILGDGVPDRIMAALNRYNVLVFPRLHLPDEDFLALTAVLGDMQQSSVTDDGSTAAEKGIFRIALDKDDKTQLDFIRGNDHWHMDGTSYSVPGKATLLKCEVAPAEGGDTGFANLFAAYAALPEERRAALEGLRVVHCLAAVGKKLYADPTEDDFRRWEAVFPPREHPLVWKQKDGRSSMVIGSTADDIVGMEHEAGMAILRDLMDWATGPAFTYRHAWQAGDLVIFNNPGLLHRSYPYEASAGRVMHRTTLKGVEATA
ncbi:TauD/TfdA family dioxygenase [Sphingomonas naphthae]|uniref:TauD/TfdA family dioxygenase n=1 Tax=Sphingomonas naphthae TaxID=1813468 RepID=A0ABY7TNZ6_9SPHN|nr:TauD/TfdA family dioxygenase [Sphingomonas naphthae]WCT74426.1 TauD/TfdA family dioxygenase [Sphingomonas naphthae]